MQNLMTLVVLIVCLGCSDKQYDIGHADYEPPKHETEPFSKNISANCVDKALFCANTVMHAEGWDVRIVLGPSGDEHHVQAQAYVTGGAQPSGWYWLTTPASYAKIGGQDEWFQPERIMSINELRELRQP